MLIKPIVRFVTRGTEDGQVDLIIGAAIRNQDALMPNCVYEVREVLGEAMLIYVGKMTEIAAKQIQTHSIADLVNERGKYLYLTQQEIDQLKDNTPS